MTAHEKTLIEKYIDSNSFGRLTGMQFNIIADGEVDYYLTVTKGLLATPQAAHGGMIAALSDAALGVAALSAVYKDNRVVSTVEYKINFLKPALLNDQLLAKGKVVQQGKRILVSTCDIFCVNRNDQLIAKSMGTFNAYDAAKAGY